MRLVEITKTTNDYPDIRKFVKHELHLEKYTITSDGTVNTSEKVSITSFTKPENNLVKLPIKFGVVKNKFEIFQCKKLLTLEGCPDEVDEINIAFCHSLKDLEHFPKKVNKEAFISSCNELISLKGLQDIEIKEMLSIRDCENLNSFDGLPTTTHALLIRNLPSIRSLKGLSETVKGVLILRLRNLTTLEYLPKHIYGELTIEAGDKITNLLRVFSVKGLTHIKFDIEESSEDSIKITEIINKWLPSKDVIECQEELIEAGFKRFARIK